MKKILLITTGGTIASKPGPTGLCPQLTSEQLIEYVPEIKDICNFDTISLFNLDSTNIGPNHWVQIVQVVKKNYNNYSGFVITHGTDTLSYTAAALSYMIQNSPKPIILTGSQKSIYLRDSDARANVIDAFTYAADDKSKGVCIVFNGNVILGTRARKTRTQSYNAFDSIDYPVIAQIVKGRIIPYITYPKENGLPSFSLDLDPRIIVLKLIPGISGEAIKALGENYRAIVIESFGCGGLPDLTDDSIKEAVKEYAKEGGIVVMTTQVTYEGSCMKTYEVGSDLCQLNNIIEGGNMTIESICCKLMWVLGQSQDTEEIKQLFLTPINFDIV